MDQIVIAIKDAPIVNSKYGEVSQAYKIGDKFKLISNFGEEIVIWHPLIDSTMAVNAKNFEQLNKFRDNKINSIL